MSEYEFLRPEVDVVVFDRGENQVSWYTFAGALINSAIADVVGAKNLERVRADDFGIRIDGSVNARATVDQVKAKTALEIRGHFNVAEEFLDNLKFNECLPSDLAEEILKARLLDLDELKKSLSREVFGSIFSLHF